MIILLEVIFAFILVGAFVHFIISKRKNNYRTSLLAQHMNISIEMKRTLAMGLYVRFKKESAENPPLYSSTYIKQDPLMFEGFVADVVEKARGGSTGVTVTSGDFGVDFVHRTKEGLFLGQVKCCQKDVAFDPIALIHSNMVKRGAKGGYVITTSSFTSSTRQYAEGLNIELIDGVKLVELWVSGLVHVEQEIKKNLPNRALK